MTPHCMLETDCRAPGFLNNPGSSCAHACRLTTMTQMRSVRIAVQQEKDNSHVQILMFTATN